MNINKLIFGSFISFLSIYGGWFIAGTLEPKVIEKVLREENFSPLDVRGNTDDGTWEILYGNYLNSRDSERMKGLTLSREVGDLKIKDQRILILKKKCKKLLSELYSSSDQKSYIDAKGWCTAKSPKAKPDPRRVGRSIPIFGW